MRIYVYMCVYVCICMYMCIYVYICVYMCIYNLRITKYTITLHTIVSISL